MKRSKSAEALDLWIRERRKEAIDGEGNFTVSWFAAAVGASREALHNWIHGAATPRLEHAKEVEKLTKGAVPMSGW